MASSFFCRHKKPPSPCDARRPLLEQLGRACGVDQNEPFTGETREEAFYLKSFLKLFS
jgi:hypothetical protein